MTDTERRNLFDKVRFRLFDECKLLYDIDDADNRMMLEAMATAAVIAVEEYDKKNA